MGSDHTTPVAARAALLTIDVQRDFAERGAPFEIPGTADLVPRMQELVAAFREAERPVIHVVRLYRRDGSKSNLKGLPWTVAISTNCFANLRFLG